MWLLLSLIVEIHAAGDTCNILALGGGSDKGAYQAGGIVGLIKYLPQGDAQWDVVTGTGIGAINGLIVSQTEIGSEAIAASTLTSFWTNFVTSQFYKSWIGGITVGYFYKTGLYDTAPMVKTISTHQSGPFKRFLGIGTTDLISGAYVFFNSTGQTSAAMGTGILASVAEAGTFPLVPYKTFKLVSGAVKATVDLLQGILACESMGYDESSIVIDVVLAAGKSLAQTDPSTYRSLNVLMRHLEISSADNQDYVIESAEYAYPSVNIRSVVLNTAKLPDPFDPYNYTKAQLLEQLSIGEEDAKNAVQDIV